MVELLLSRIFFEREEFSVNLDILLLPYIHEPRQSQQKPSQQQRCVDIALGWRDKGEIVLNAGIEKYATKELYT